MSVLDASALLAFLQDEPGADQVEQALKEGAVIGAANWSEVMQKSLRAGRDWALAKQLVEAFDVVVEPVTQADAELAASNWAGQSALSLADRLCLALAVRLATDVLTADKAWGSSDGVRQIR